MQGVGQVITWQRRENKNTQKGVEEKLSESIRRGTVLKKTCRGIKAPKIRRDKTTEEKERKTGPVDQEKGCPKRTSRK